MRAALRTQRIIGMDGPPFARDGAVDQPVIAVFGLAEVIHRISSVTTTRGPIGHGFAAV